MKTNRIINSTFGNENVIFVIYKQHFFQIFVQIILVMNSKHETENPKNNYVKIFFQTPCKEAKIKLNMGLLNTHYNAINKILNFYLKTVIFKH